MSSIFRLCRSKSRGTAATIGARIVHFEFALAAEAADNIDFPAHFGHRYLGAGGGHWSADGPTANALGEGRPSEQGTAGQRDELAPVAHSITSSARASRMSDGQRSYNLCPPSHT